MADNQIPGGDAPLPTGPGGGPPVGGGPGNQPPPPAAGGGTGGFTTPQSPSASPAVLGAYDAYAQQAFGGATAPEAEIYNQFQQAGTGQGAYGDYTKGLINASAANIAAGGGIPGQDLGAQWNAGGQQFAGTDTAGQTAAQQRQLYTSMANGGGYDAATKAQIANEGNAALNAQESGVRDQLNNAAARTGSPVGAYGAIVDANHNIGNQRSALARQNQILFANEAERQKEAGAAGLGQNTSLTTGLENAGVQNALAANNQASNQKYQGANNLNQLINDDTSRRFAGLNAANQQNNQQRGYQLAGAGGLNSILQGQMGQQDQLASMIASILGNKQGDTTQLGENGQSLQLTP